MSIRNHLSKNAFKHSENYKHKHTHTCIHSFTTFKHPFNYPHTEISKSFTTYYCYDDDDDEKNTRNRNQSNPSMWIFALRQPIRSVFFFFQTHLKKTTTTSINTRQVTVIDKTSYLLENIYSIHSFKRAKKTIILWIICIFVERTKTTLNK